MKHSDVSILEEMETRRALALATFALLVARIAKVEIVFRASAAICDRKC